MKTDDILKLSTDSPLAHSHSPVEDLDSVTPAVINAAVMKAAVANAAVGGAAVAKAAAVAKPRRVAPPQSVRRGGKLRDLSAEQAFELLSTARTADHVELYLRDGRVVDGAILFNEIKGTGRIINVTKEVSVDFRADNVRDIRF